MATPLLLVTLGVCVLCLIALACILWQLRSAAAGRLPPQMEATLAQGAAEILRLRDTLQLFEKHARDEAHRQRQELHAILSSHRDELSSAILKSASAQHEALSRFGDSQTQAAGALREELARARVEITGAVQKMSADSGQLLSTTAERIHQQMAQEASASAASGEKLRASVELKLGQIQSAAETRLEQMRATVDEKLSSTLSTRLGESFKQVSDRLEAVQQGFGEMRSLAGNVVDLRRVMTNVKTRGVWGEVQLGNLLSQLFPPSQYEANFKPRPRSGEVVEFAIKLPGPDGHGDPVFLPIDSKFPLEDYQRLVAASETADATAQRAAQKALENRIYACATDIRAKYIVPPTTTNFAVLFLPTEALYAEVIQIPGLLEDLTRNYKVIVQGPTTFSAFAMALLMGFRTLSIQKRSAEIDKLLGAVRTDFGKFSDLLGKVEEKLDEAKTNLSKARGRSHQIVRKLSRVEALPEEQTALLLPDPSLDPDALPAPDEGSLPL
jgi:DNA recombination protein RmuC